MTPTEKENLDKAVKRLANNRDFWTVHDQVFESFIRRVENVSSEFDIFFKDVDPAVEFKARQVAVTVMRTCFGTLRNEINKPDGEKKIDDFE